MAEVLQVPLLTTGNLSLPPLLSPLNSTTQLPSNRQTHHLHRGFSPEGYVNSLEERLKARKKGREKQRHLEALLADAAMKGSSDSSLINDSLMKFVDDNNINSNKNNNLPKINNEFDKITKTKNGTKISWKTLSTSPGPLPLPAPTQSTVKISNSEENSSSGKEDTGEFGEIVSAVWGKVKGMIGFTPDCLNGGTKRLGGKCFCPEYFLGEHCEKRQCLNNGTLQRVLTIPPEEICKCTNPLYITGKHCETIHCQNGGRPLSNGTCKCIDNWYTGQFCEYYAASWFAVLGIPLICIAVIALCCVICRLDFCPKRTPPPSYRENRRRNRGLPDTRRHHNHRHPYSHDDPQTLMIHENLLNDHCQQHFRRLPTASHSSGQIVRLEHIPVYNPNLTSLPTDEYKPLEPPPSYEQAVSTCPAISTPIASTRQPQPPPIYSPPRDDSSQPRSSRPPEDSPPPH
jgi:hypothetical protein